MVHHEQITFDTTGHRQMDDLTDKVAAIVEHSGITTGRLTVFPRLILLAGENYRNPKRKRGLNSYLLKL